LARRSLLQFNPFKGKNGLTYLWEWETEKGILQAQDSVHLVARRQELRRV
jgi:hypothetical protein